MRIRIKKLYPNAVVPQYAHFGDAAVDLVAIRRWEDKKGKICYGTGLAMEIPENHVGLLFPRSSIAKTVLRLANAVGVIDSGYRGEIKVLLINLNFEGYNLKPNAFEAMFGSANKIEIKPGDRIAQLIIEKCHTAEWKAAETLEDSQRGERGFGSSGQ